MKDMTEQQGRIEFQHNHWLIASIHDYNSCTNYEFSCTNYQFSVFVFTFMSRLLVFVVIIYTRLVLICHVIKIIFKNHCTFKYYRSI